jgi:HSP20 family protein
MDEDVKNFFESLSVHAAPHAVPASEPKEQPEAVLASVRSDMATARVAPRRTAETAMVRDTAEESEPTQVFDEGDFGEGDGQLTVDVYQTPDEIVIQSTIAGVTPSLLEVSISNEMVTIRGKREKSEVVEGKDYFVQELYWGKFSRSIILPQEIDSESAAADLKNGVLTVRLPKIKKQKVKKLKIKF